MMTPVEVVLNVTLSIAFYMFDILKRTSTVLGICMLLINLTVQQQESLENAFVKVAGLVFETCTKLSCLSGLVSAVLAYLFISL